MSHVHRLLEQFVTEDRAGGVPDPLVFLEQVEGPERDELEELLDSYLAEAPRRPFDAAAFEASPARALADDLARGLDGAAGAWPALLPRLRHRAQLKRAELVARLAAELGVAGHEAKVGTYYHRMEQGTLPAAGVSDRVLQALATLLGESAQRLRDAGTAMRPAPGAAESVLFARTGTPDPELTEQPPPAPASPGTTAPEHDEVDDLFTGTSDDHP